MSPKLDENKATAKGTLAVNEFIGDHLGAIDADQDYIQTTLHSSPGFGSGWPGNLGFPQAL